MKAEEHLIDYKKNGFTVFKEIVPLSLISDLRKETDKAREIARKIHGPQTQRLQPISNYASEINLKPFDDYHHLPEINDLIQKMFTPEFHFNEMNRIGVLFEPTDLPYCTFWHRDWRDHMEVEIFEEFFKKQWDNETADISFAAQVNCPLYEDSCTWYVPGSHCRQTNFKEEENVRDNFKTLNLSKLNYEEREAKCRKYAESMPKSVQFQLKPGDFALYQSCGWHLGNYVPYKKRATLHHGVLKGDMTKYYSDRTEKLAEIRKRRKVLV